VVALKSAGLEASEMFPASQAVELVVVALENARPEAGGNISASWAVELVVVALGNAGLEVGDISVTQAMELVVAAA